GSSAIRACSSGSDLRSRLPGRSDRSTSVDAEALQHLLDRPTFDFGDRLVEGDGRDDHEVALEGRDGGLMDPARAGLEDPRDAPPVGAWGGEGRAAELRDRDVPILHLLLDLLEELAWAGAARRPWAKIDRHVRRKPAGVFDVEARLEARHWRAAEHQ